jgi:TRAP-type C4-dicarboxylate transport system permease small subunit
MLRRCLDLIYEACGLLACISLLAIVCIVVTQIIGRLCGVLIPSSDEFAGYALAASTFLGLAYTFRVNGHIRVGMLTSRLTGKAKRAAEIYALLLGVAVLSYFTWYIVDMTWTSYDFDEVSPGLIPVPLWIPQGIIAIGILLIAVSMLDELVSVLRGSEPVYAMVDGEIMQAE